MNKEIYLTSDNGYHFGSKINLNKLSGGYFITNKPDDYGFQYKAVIFCVTYQPDDDYIKSYGRIGNCWRAIINDSRFVGNDYTYNVYFRNFSDLINYYEIQSMTFFPYPNNT